jgi:hypothetical protein
MIRMKKFYPFTKSFTGLLTAVLCFPLLLLVMRSSAQGFTEDFDDINTLTANDWVMINHSSPIGSTNWFQGNTGVFNAYNGADTAYVATNFNNTAGTGTISNWLIMPNVTLHNGDKLTFFTRKASPDTYPDRLELRLSTNGASTDVGSLATDVGDFTTLMLSVNPTLVTGVYPITWTQYTVTISGLSGPTSGRMAFRYFVTNGGPSGSNSDYIGIDNVVFTSCFAVSGCPGDITVAAGVNSCDTVVTFTPPSASYSCTLPQPDTLFYTGQIDTFTIPATWSSVRIEAVGAEGGNNISSTVAPGLGAVISGDFTLTPGSQLKILVGQQPSVTGGNGGGGGTFVTDINNNPLVIAGGGAGSSDGVTNPNKDGNITGNGGDGISGGGSGGTSGNGGSAGVSFYQSGAGGGLLTDGADGTYANGGGKAFVNGGAGGNVYAHGGFGGGGSGSLYAVGGAGGGYSGGGSGSNSTGPDAMGGGGGSYNGGINQTNIAGVNSGHGMVIIKPLTITPSVTLVQGLAPGSTFPVGATTEQYLIDDGVGDTSYCTFTVTVTNNLTPTVTCPGAVTFNTGTCQPQVVNGLAPTLGGINGCTTVSYTLSGATTGSGANDASGNTFNLGTTTVKYVATNINGNADSCTFTVTVADTSMPTVTCPGNVSMDIANCTQVVNNIAPTLSGTNTCSIVSYSLSGVTTGSGLNDASGLTFNEGVTTVQYIVLNGNGNADTCSFTVTINDTLVPSISCPGNVTTCTQAVTQIAPVVTGTNACSNVSYTLTGATTGSGVNDASGTIFNVGTTYVTYIVTNANGYADTCSFFVNVNSPTGILAGNTVSPEAINYYVLVPADVRYTDCDLIASIAPSGGNPTEDSVNFKVTIDNTPPSYNGQPYVKRHYDIEPHDDVASTATITLYAYQYEFDDYNSIAVPMGYPPLPSGGVDNGNVRITQFHGVGTTPGNYPGSEVLITPTVNWNTTYNYWEMTFPVNGYSGFYIHTGAYGALAIGISDISAANKGLRNRIDWTTAHEDNGAIMSLERSADGVNFNRIADIATHGKPSGYTYWDETPVQGVNYYRVKVTGASGDISYTKIVTATVKAATGQLAITAVPNPVKDKVTVSIYGSSSQSGMVEVMDPTGKRLLQYTTENNSAIIDMSGLASGIYFIRYSDNTGSVSTRIDKQ